MVTHFESPTVSHPPRPLDNVPAPVRARIEDMLRVEAMISKYLPLTQHAAERRTLLSKAAWKGTELMRRARSDPLPSEVINDAEREFQELADRNTKLAYDEPVGEVRINNTLNVDYQMANRLACEAELLFFHMALELIPKEDVAFVKQEPLLHCLKRARNVAVHYRPLGVAQADFHVSMVDQSASPAPPKKIIFSGSWHLTVCADDIKKTQGPIDQSLFDWFVDLCDKYPLWFLLQASVELLSRYYDKKAGNKGQ